MPHDYCATITVSPVYEVSKALQHCFSSGQFMPRDYCVTCVRSVQACCICVPHFYVSVVPRSYNPSILMVIVQRRAFLNRKLDDNSVFDLEVCFTSGIWVHHFLKTK